MKNEKISIGNFSIRMENELAKDFETKANHFLRLCERYNHEYEISSKGKVKKTHIIKITKCFHRSSFSLIFKTTLTGKIESLEVVGLHGLHKYSSKSNNTSFKFHSILEFALMYMFRLDDSLRKVRRFFKKEINSYYVTYNRNYDVEIIVSVNHHYLARILSDGVKIEKVIPNFPINIHHNY